MMQRAALFVTPGRRFLALALALCFFAQIPATALAAVGNDTTTLYYLIELQRRYGKKCDGQEMPAAPSLVPSEELSAALADHAANNTPMPELLTKYNISVNKFTVLRTPINTPQKTMTVLLSSQCRELMGPYTMVGSTRAQGQWWLLLVEPGKAPTPPVPDLPGEDPATGAPVQPGYAPGSAAAPGAVAQAPAYQAPATQPVKPTAPPDPNVIPLNESGFPDPNFVPGQSAPNTSNQQTLAPQTSQTQNSGGNFAYMNSGASQSNPAYPVNSAGAAGAIGATDSAAQIQSLYSLLNQARTTGRTCGTKAMPPVPPFKKSAKLESAARKQAADMGARNYFSSTSPEGRKLEDRLKTENYHWMFIGELLAKAQPPAANVANLWLDKPQQCETIMNPNFTEAGIGYLPAGEIWVFTFGSSAPDDAEAVRLE